MKQLSLNVDYARKRHHMIRYETNLKRTSTASLRHDGKHSVSDSQSLPAENRIADPMETLCQSFSELTLTTKLSFGPSAHQQELDLKDANRLRRPRPDWRAVPTPGPPIPTPRKSTWMQNVPARSSPLRPKGTPRAVRTCLLTDNSINLMYARKWARLQRKRLVAIKRVKWLRTKFVRDDFEWGKYLLKRRHQLLVEKEKFAETVKKVVTLEA